MTNDHCPRDRWSWVEISKSALRYNVKSIRKLIGPKTDLMAVVKADAYGHGARECCRVFAAAGANQFAVATVEEGADLRRGNIKLPILLLCEPPLGAIEDLLKYDIMPTVQTSEFALAYGEAADAAGKIGAYHLGIDTGMTRNGVDWRDVVELRTALDFHRGLQCKGTFTHFATAEVRDDWDFQLQYSRFSEAIDALRDAGFDPGIIHCDNMAAAVMHPTTQHDMVRCGIGLYGLYPDPVVEPHIDLRPAMSVHAKVTRTSYPAVGAGVSYGMTWRVPKSNVQVASIPIGYADGYHRAFSGRVDVLCGGKRFRQVGSICMDHCMFAVEVNEQRQFGAVEPVSVGDEVIVMGTQGDQTITAEDLAQLASTINYEILCDFGMRLKRVYV